MKMLLQKVEDHPAVALPIILILMMASDGIIELIAGVF